MQIYDWFKVTFDSNTISLNVNPPGGEAWNKDIPFSHIIRVCFNAQGYLVQDELIIFSNEQPENCVVPMEANGASDLFNELIERKLFDAKLAIEAAAGEGLYVWPPEK